MCPARNAASHSAIRGSSIHRGRFDIEKQLARAFKGTLFLNEAVPGRDSAQWKLSLPRVQREIGTFGFDAIVLSSGGNDVVGDELLEYVKTAAQAQSAGSTNWGPIPPEVLDYVRLELFEHALGYAIADFREIVQYRNMYSPGTIIFVHTYDYIYPSGRSVPARPDHDRAVGQACARCGRPHRSGSAAHRHELAARSVRRCAAGVRVAERERARRRFSRHADVEAAVAERDPSDEGGLCADRERVLGAGVDRRPRLTAAAIRCRGDARDAAWGKG